MDPLLIDASAGSATISSVAVHPVVLFSVLDHHVRRNTDQDRVIGALLGTVAHGVATVTNSFGVFHVKKGEEEVLVKRTTMLEMLELHRRVNPKEVLIGWYSTWMGGAAAAAERRAGASAPSAGAGGATSSSGAGVAESSHIDDFTLVVHQFFAEVSGAIRPLHLLVDVSLRQPRIATHAYVTVSNPLLRNVLIPFQQLRVSLVAGTEERVGVDTMVRAMLSGREPVSRDTVSPLGDARDLAPDAEALEGSMKRVKKLLDVVAGYVDEVVAGTRPGDEAIGRAIADTLAAVPSLEAEGFERSLNRSVQDLLMVTYLANITMAQLKVAERIAMLPPRT